MQGLLGLNLPGGVLHGGGFAGYGSNICIIYAPNYV